jgi:protein-S-isoprenylcysteine O-methyltransferase Ste14
MAGMKPNVWVAAEVAVGGLFLFVAAVLFGSAGTLAWPAAWAFLILYFGPGTLNIQALARDNPALFDELRKLLIKKPRIKKGQPLWSKIIKATSSALFTGWLVLTGLDAGRFHWSAIPAWLQWIGAAGILVAAWIRYRTVKADRLLPNVVRIQTERGDEVVTEGPYGYVRHPRYAADLLSHPSAALLLGSWFGLAVAIPLAGVSVLRTALADRELHRRLDGYADYAQWVRYRLVPWVW